MSLGVRRTSAEEVDLKTGNTSLRWILVIVIVTGVIILFQTSFLKTLGGGAKKESYHDFLTRVENNNASIAKIQIQKDEIYGQFKPSAVPPGSDNLQFTVVMPDAPEARSSLYALLQTKGVPFEFTKPFFS